METIPSFPIFTLFPLPLTNAWRQKSDPSELRTMRVFGNWEKLDNSYERLERAKVPVKRIRQVRRGSAVPDAIQPLTVSMSLQKEYERLAEEMKRQR